MKVTKKSIYGRDVKYNTWHPSPGGLKLNGRGLTFQPRHHGASESVFHTTAFQITIKLQNLCILWWQILHLWTCLDKYELRYAKVHRGAFWCSC